ncbi:hypothetical protein QBC34DRAFT_496784 [Podospora aff. communis PSN243]|uniref:Uncharacterized protein n=1 Tax=Podospora aff. communis PSN243 TaxID=3040156 RepID=A0AAV9GDG5_9PEZI|nr:hypothetical protein QBC34DRAFT_496784 [Podospora aff. communis PSN243]
MLGSGFNPIAGFDPGRMPGQPAPQNAGFNPRDGRDLGPAPPIMTRPGAAIPALMPSQWPTGAPTSTYQPAIAAPPPAAPAQVPFYGIQRPQAPAAPAPAPFSFPTPAAIATAISGTLVTTQPTPPPDNLPLKPPPGTLPPIIHQITWPPTTGTTITTGTTTTVTPSTGTALTLPGRPNPTTAFPPPNHLKIRILHTSLQPWTIPSPSSTPIPITELWVPESLTIRSFLHLLGRTPPERTIIYEVSAGGNGKLYKGLEVHGYMPGVLDKTLKSVGWDASRSGRVGERGHRGEEGKVLEEGIW